MNKYLLKFAEFEKSALRRIVEEIAKGTVKTPTFVLAAHGFIKSPTTYAKGMRLGNANLSKAYNAPISSARAKNMKPMLDAAGGFITLPHKSGPKIMHGGAYKPALTRDVPKGHSFSRQHEDIRNSVILRHELHEAREMRESTGLIRKTFKNAQEATASMFGNKVAVPSTGEAGRAVRMASNLVKHDNIAHYSGHFSPRVLGRESEDIRKNPYLKNATLAKIRNQGHEAADLFDVTGKRYGKDKFTGTDLKKLHNSVKHS
jgi:hypothetical protein